MEWGGIGEERSWPAEGDYSGLSSVHTKGDSDPCMWMFGVGGFLYVGPVLSSLSLGRGRYS